MNNHKNNLETIVLGGGCFWCLEALYNRIKGVEFVISGYSGGNQSISRPTYEQVSSGKTGHAEVVQIMFDPSVISLEDILRIFFAMHDPTTLNRQGSDIGTQYRSIILYNDEQQYAIVDKIMREVAQAQLYEAPLVTELAQLKEFYPAEGYHQKYYEKNPDKAYCQLVVAPKLAKFREKFSKLLKE